MNSERDGMGETTFVDKEKLVLTTLASVLVFEGMMAERLREAMKTLNPEEMERLCRSIAKRSLLADVGSNSESLVVGYLVNLAIAPARGKVVWSEAKARVEEDGGML